MPLQSNYTSFNHPMQATRRESLPRWRTQPSLKRVGPYIPSLATADHQKYESPKDRAMNQLMNQGADLHYTSYAPKRDEAARYGQDGYGSPDFPDTDDVTTMPTMESMDLTAVTTDHHHEIHDFSPSYEEWNNYDDELSTLTSQENHVAATSFATPSEHQFPKLPYAEIMNRALPPLPESVSEDNSASQPKTQLRRAATWLGKPIDQFLSSNQVYSLGRKMSQGLPQTQRGGSADHNDMIYYEETTRHDDNHYHAGMEVTPTVNAETMQGSRRVDRHPASAEERFYGTDTDHFGFLRSHMNNLHTVSPVTIVKRTYAPTKVLKKKTIHCQVKQVINKGSSRDYLYELHLQLNDITQLSEKGSLKGSNKRTSIDLRDDISMSWSVKGPFTMTFIVAARPAHAWLSRMGIVQQPLEPMPVVGFLRLTSAGDHGLESCNQGTRRYQLTKPKNIQIKGLELELVIDLQVQEEQTSAGKLFSKISAQRPGFSYQSLSSELDADIRAEDLKAALAHCKAGDYLTFYVRGLAFPTWKRYWVTLKDSQLVLRDFSYKDKGPVDILPLGYLKDVHKPSCEDEETVCIDRQKGVVLQFDRTSAVMVQPVRLDEDEGLEGKMYLLADNMAHAIHWRRALGNSTFENRDIGVNLKYLW